MGKNSGQYKTLDNKELLKTQGSRCLKGRGRDGYGIVTVTEQKRYLLCKPCPYRTVPLRFSCPVLRTITDQFGHFR